MKQEWEQAFSERIWQHSDQNTLISKDFLCALTGEFNAALHEKKRILEIGCGTGELLWLMNFTFRPDIAFGTDLSEEAVNFANKHYRKLNLQYRPMDMFKGRADGEFDLCVLSNVLEHFKGPQNIIDMLKGLYDCDLLILVPYKQDVLDEGADGGLGHLSTFDEDSFEDIKHGITFKSNAWQHGKDPRQLAVLI
jgi:2-polyprenyl-3-methyl-5-hydroxy-6-metoxy-1,4-benzoquinol methylase